VNSGLPRLRNYGVNLVAFKEASVHGESDHIKTIPRSEYMKNSQELNGVRDWIARGKAVGGTLLDRWFVHSLGLLRGHLNPNNILPDCNHREQMVDVGPICPEVRKRKSGAFQRSDRNHTRR
jgi:hypothetical protein